ncbi:hypothetical protein [Halococcus sp. IIIV-5B]|uniref:hypothetical protein n=1 Tax=Halococcus sp. IIIV-5B TaxID=2321230 RepID=UPI0011C43444|nr:hypothetical protein [Halococcus sp. IIIV-5B]
MTWGQYHVEISNKGRSLASNCKPKVRFVGHQDTTEQRPRLGPDGIESRDVSVYKRYIIDITPSWNESTSPTRVDLNRGETAQFDLFAVHSEPAPPDGIDSRIQFGEQKTIDEIRESGEVWETNPVRIETYEEEESSHPLVDTAPKLSKDDLDNIEWSEQKIQVTSADASRLEGILDITWNGSTPEVEVQ